MNVRSGKGRAGLRPGEEGRPNALTVRPGKSHGFLVASISFALSVIAAELLLWILFPIDDPYADRKHVNQYIRSEFPQNYFSETEIEPGLPGMQGKHRFSTNNMGFRGDDMVMPKPRDEYRIFIVGGSAAECLYLDESESFGRIVQDELERRNPDRRIRVYNAGKSGDASDDHVSMIAHRIVHLSPDMIILFCGFNDLLMSIYSYDYLHYVRSDKGELSAPWKILKLFFSEFQIPRRIIYLTNKLAGSSERKTLEVITKRTNYRAKVYLRRSHPETEMAPRMDVEPYRNNLETIIGMARIHGIRLLLMTQQTTWNSTVDPKAKEWHWMRYQNGVTYGEGLMDEAMERLNDATREVGKKHSIPVFDLARIIPKSSAFIYDDVHFNPKGAYTAGAELASFMTESALLTRSVH